MTNQDMDNMLGRSRSKQIRQHLEDMFGFAPIGICHVDTQGRISMINPEFAWMLGYESSQMLKKQISDYAAEVFFDPEQAEEFLFTLREADQVSRFRCRLKKRDNSYIWAQCYARATRDDSGRIDGFHGYAVDIGDTVKTEEALKKANQKLTALSIMDGLTEIPNRRKFDQCLASEWNRHLRTQKELSVIICDIDFFKNYNDAYGHQAGDICLQQVAKALDSCVNRSADLTARYGGEEFGVILPDTDARGAGMVAGKIRRTINDLKIRHRDSSACAWVTMSLGTGTLVPQKGQPPSALLELADTALYTAKDRGRNQYVIGTGRPAE